MIFLRQFAFRVVWSKKEVNVVIVEAESKGQAKRKLAQAYTTLGDVEFLGEVASKIL